MDGYSFYCKECDRYVEVCKSCYRGQRYCSQSCRDMGYNKCKKRAQFKYRKTFKAKLKAAMRQQKFRVKSKIVTHPSSKSIISPYTPKRTKTFSPPCCLCCGKRLVQPEQIFKE